MSLISIIVPVYNVEKYLNHCVDSILNQSLKDFELILVDDGSPDNCGKLCLDYAEKDSRIIIIHKMNGGLSDARNIGIKVASGDWIAFVDSDDYVDKDYLLLLYNAAVQNNADLSVCDFTPIYEDGTIIEGWGNLPDVTLKDQADMIRMIDSHWKIVPAWNKLYKVTLFENLEFAKGKLHEDEFFIHRVLAKCDRVSIISDTLYYYLQRNGSITSSKTMKNKLDVLEANIQRYSFCKERWLPTNKDFMSLDYLDKVVTEYRHIDKRYKKQYRSLKRQYKKLFFSEKSNRKPANYIRYYNNSLYYRLFHLVKR